MSASTPIAKKLQIKPGHRVKVRGAPKSTIGPLPEGASFVTRGDADVAIFFVTRSSQIRVLRATRDTHPAITWFAYRKETSGVTSDLTRDEGWEPLFGGGLIGIASIAIDETWSALRVRRGTPEERAKASALREGMRRPGEKRKGTKPAAKLPDDLARAIAKSAAAKKTAATLAPSHVREYADWIESAKKPETRAARITKAVEMLAAGQRDRNAKYR